MEAEERFIQAKAQLLRCEIEMQGMIALNQFRLQRGETLAYVDEDFFNLEKKYNLENCVQLDAY